MVVLRIARTAIAQAPRPGPPRPWYRPGAPADKPGERPLPAPRSPDAQRQACQYVTVTIRDAPTARAAPFFPGRRRGLDEPGLGGFCA